MRDLKVATSLVGTVLGGSAVALVVLLGAGCVGGDNPKDDMAIAEDLAASHHDLAAPVSDLAVSKSDLAVKTDMGPRPSDMAAVPVTDLAGTHLTGLPTCTVTGVTADTLFADVAKPACANVMCHSTGAAGLTFTSGATLKSALLGVNAKQLPLMPLATASNLDASYVMYKLTGQHAAIGGRGDQMPKGAMALGDPDLCKFIVWIKEGAK